MDEDGFEAFELQTQLNSLLDNLQNSADAKAAFSLCYKNRELASKFFPLFISVFQRHPKNRRPIASLLEALATITGCEAYKLLTESAFQSLVDICLGDSESAPLDSPAITLQRQAAKGLLSLLKVFSEERRLAYAELEQRLTQTLGLSEVEQKLLKKKQRVLEQIEKDREGHKLLREASWSRPDGSSIINELMEYFYKETSDHNPLSSRSSQCHLEQFCKLKGLHFPTPNRNTPLSLGEAEGCNIAISLDELMAPLGALGRIPKITRVVSQMQKSVEDVAFRALFYGDLRSFDQPSIDYYKDDEDENAVKSLHRYIFDKDALSQHIRRLSSGNDKGKFYAERSYRYRLAAQHHDNHSSLQKRIPERMERDYRDTIRDLDRLLDGKLLDCRRAVEKLSTKNNIYLISDQHLTLAIATSIVFGFNQFIPAKNIISTTKHGLSEALKGIKRSSSEKAMYFVAPPTDRNIKGAERASFTLVPCESSLSDLHRVLSGKTTDTTEDGRKKRMKLR